MELNTKGRYAVMAMVDLAKFGGQGSVPLSDVALRQDISQAYLEQLFQQLRRADLVSSVRGRSGGYLLARAATEISVGDIILAVGEQVEMRRCKISGVVGCVGDSRCLTHDLWRALGKHVVDFLSDVSLQQIVEGRFSRHAAFSGSADEPGLEASSQ